MRTEHSSDSRHLWWISSENKFIATVRTLNKHTDIHFFTYAVGKNKRMWLEILGSTSPPTEKSFPELTENLNVIIFLLGFSFKTLVLPPSFFFFLINWCLVFIRLQYRDFCHHSTPLFFTFLTPLLNPQFRSVSIKFLSICIRTNALPFPQ